MSIITVFSTPKPFINPHIAMIQTNAIRSWMHLGRGVDALLIGEEDGVSQVAKREGIRLIRDVARNKNGTPLVNSIFKNAQENSKGPLLAYVNADILLTPKFCETVKLIHSQANEFLAVGRRWDLDIRHPLEFSKGWVDRLDELVKKSAKLHSAGGSDFFIFPRGCYQSIPDLAIGRAGWDNWMIYEARRNGWPVVETTPTYMVIHQQHDYSHLPGGKPHHHHPESDENVRLAGGRQTIYTLMDTNYLLKDGKLKRVPITWNKFWREVEIFPTTGLGSRSIAGIFYTIFHPIRAFHRFRVWLSRTRRKWLL